MGVILTDPNQLPDNIKNNLDIDPKVLQEEQYMLKDLLQGDMAVFDKLPVKEAETLKKALQYITEYAKGSPEEFASLFAESWRILYRAKPPTPEEFLTEKYIGPQSKSTYPYLKQEFIKFMDPNASYRNLILYPHIGWGKLVYKESVVYTPNGPTQIKNIHVGDEVCTPSGGVSHVMNVQNYPNEKIYKLKFSDGRTALAGGPHFWKAAHSTNNIIWNKELKRYETFSPAEPCWKIITTEKIIEDLKENPKHRWFIPMTKPVSHTAKSHIIPPYTLGALLGDGNLNVSAAYLGCDDKEIFERIIEETDQSNCYLKFKEVQNQSVNYQLYFQKKDLSENKYNAELKRLGLYGTNSYTKFIPEEYLYDSLENRVALLQGLMDTDGTVANKKSAPKPSFCTRSTQLRDDFLELVRGLGGKVSTSSDKDGTWYVGFTFPEPYFDVFHLQRKQSYLDVEAKRDRFKRRPQYLYIESIEETDLVGGMCIETDDPEHLFLTDSYTVTHNSTMTTLIVMYIITCLSLLKDPYKQFGLAPSTSICAVLVSFNLTKAREVLLRPFNNILECSPFFEKVPRKEKMAMMKEEFKDKEEVDKLYYTTADPDCELMFDSGIGVKVASDFAKLLGLTIVTLAYSELSFFTDAGKSPEFIMRLYNDGVGRVASRFFGNYYGRTILDSSPNSLDNPIDDFINHEARKLPSYYIVDGSQWKWKPEKFKEDIANNRWFKVFTGSKGQTPKVLLPDDPMLFDKDTDFTKIIDVPESLRNQFEMDLVKSIKDFAGIPSGSSDSLINDYSVIERMFDTPLKNVYQNITASTQKEPQRLIFDQIVNTFFRKKADKYEFYYKPWIPRYLSVDQSYATDVTGISMCHKERLKEGGAEVFIVDFTIPIVPISGDKINLESIRCFIKELRDIGNLHIAGVSFDQFQSQNTIQNLERDGFTVKKISVDISDGPYLNLISYMNQGRVFCGKNIFFKNNLKSLQIVKPKDGKGKPKIDHDSTKPQIVEGDPTWDKSFIGRYGKDVSDSVAASIELCESLYPIAQDNWDPKELIEAGNAEIEREKAREKVQNSIKFMF